MWWLRISYHRLLNYIYFGSASDDENDDAISIMSDSSVELDEFMNTGYLKPKKEKV